MKRLDRNDYRNGSYYIAKKFEKQITEKSKVIYPHFTCATGEFERFRTDLSVAELHVSEKWRI